MYQPTVTTAYQIGISWTAGAYNGGSQVLDYVVSFKEQSAVSYTIFQSGLTQTSVTVTSLTPGTTYRFVVQARNIVGLSVYSAHVDILAAQVPDAPTSLRNQPQVTTADQIGLTWYAPSFDGGSPVTEYIIWYDNATGFAFSILAEGFFATDYVVLNTV